MTKLVVIDPGHGGSDPGAVGNGLRESDLTLSIAKRIRSILLRDFDVDVKLTRRDDSFVSLGARAQFANDRNATYFVSVHINAGGGTGYEDYIHPSAGQRTADWRDDVHGAIAPFVQQRGIINRGKKRKNLAVLRQTDMPAVLTENLFIDKASDANKLKDPSFLDGLAKAHARGIAAALNLPRAAVPVA